jgi:hypothetical protein
MLPYFHFPNTVKSVNGNTSVAGGDLFRVVGELEGLGDSWGQDGGWE